MITYVEPIVRSLVDITLERAEYEEAFRVAGYHEHVEAARRLGLLLGAELAHQDQLRARRTELERLHPGIEKSC